MAKHKTCFQFPRCGYYEGKLYKCGIALYQRKRDSSFFIIEDGKRINVAIINGHGTVIKLPDTNA